MRFGWHIPLPGPFSVGGTLWRSKSRKRSKRPAWHGTAPGWKCPHEHRTQEAANECARKHLKTAAPAAPAPARTHKRNRPAAPVIYPEPAPYVYYRVTAARLSEDRATLIMDLLSDSGEPWQDIEVPVTKLGLQKSGEIKAGDRFTWDGESLENYVPAGLQPDMQRLVAKINAMPAENRAAARCDADTVQTFRQSGYGFGADNRVVPVGQS